MRTKLLSAALTMMLFTGITTAQTKTWDFGNDTTTWPLGAGIGNDEIIIDFLGLHPIATNTNFGAVTANNATFTDGFTAVQRFQMNGGGSPTEGTKMPTQRYLFIDVDSDCDVKVWFKTGSNDATRTIFVTDGVDVMGSGTTNDGTNLNDAIFTAHYSSATGGRLYIYGDAACNLYKVSVSGANVTTGATSGIDSNIYSTANVFAAGKQVFVSNVKSKTQVDVYTVVGALVRSFETSEDTSFDSLTTGMYIVTVKSEEGQKSVKLVVQ